MKRKLCRWENERGKTDITLELLPDGSVQIFYYDIGEDCRHAFGDSDYEAWVTVRPDELPKLTFALLADRFEGDEKALSNFRAFCEGKGVAFDHGIWT